MFFVIADIDKPILGVDFINRYGLLIDVKRCCLRNPLTNLTSTGVIHNIVTPCPAVANTYRIIKDFLNIVKPNFQKVCHGHNVTHYIVTNGPPVHAKPRRFSIQKFKYAKEGFSLMMHLDIIVPFAIIKFKRQRCMARPW